MRNKEQDSQAQEAHSVWVEGINKVQNRFSKWELTPDQFRNEHIRVTEAYYKRTQEILNK